MTRCKQGMRRTEIGRAQASPDRGHPRLLFAGEGQASHAHLALTCGNSSGGENSAGGMRGGLQPTWC